MKTIIYNADIANEGRLTRGYIVIDDEIIAEVGEGEPAAAVMAECDVRNDVDGALVMPGVIDDQVHFRDPGLTPCRRQSPSTLSRLKTEERRRCRWQTTDSLSARPTTI